MKSMLAVLLLLSSVVAPAAPVAAGSVRGVLQQQVEDWNRGDIRAFMQGYEESAGTTFVTKKVTHGWQDVLDHYLAEYPNQGKMGKLTFSDLQVRQLDANIAIATGKYHLDRTAANGGDAEGIFSLVFRKGAQGWKIVLDHTD